MFGKNHGFPKGAPPCDLRNRGTVPNNRGFYMAVLKTVVQSVITAVLDIVDISGFLNRGAPDIERGTGDVPNKNRLFGGVDCFLACSVNFLHKNYFFTFLSREMFSPSNDTKIS
jgi:hypothetical protein